MSELALQSDIKKLQGIMLKLPQAEIEATHRFTDSLYAREVFIPAGVALVGATHKTNHLYVVSSGHCEVVVDGRRETITAPFTGETKKGDKRVIYAITDTVWTTFHPTQETCLDKLGQILIEESI